MKYFTITVNDEDINFRLTSSNIQEIEKKTNKPIIEFIENVSVTNCVTLFKYMKRAEIPNFGEKDANDLFDKLVDNGYALQSMYLDIIFPACVESGLLTNSDLEKINKMVEEKQATLEKE